MISLRPELKSESPLVYLIAGEPSGDLLGSGLIDGIRKVCPGARFMGVGGPAMQRRGLDSLFPMGDFLILPFELWPPPLERCC